MNEKSVWNDFLPMSSRVDWCERNYDIIPIVAEFWNTVSNSIFFIIPPILIYLFKQYAKQVCQHVHVVWVLLIFVGIGSVYFHSTLSLVGQLVDEIAILWVCFAALATWLPNSYLPTVLQINRKRFHATILMVALVSSILAFVKPELNHGLLFMFGIPGVGFLFYELKRCKCPLVYRVGVTSALWWCMAVACWVCDRFLCNVIQFPYLHSFWHILVCISSYMACVCYAYFYASHEVPEQFPRLRFWPNDRNIWFGIPYVSLMVTAVKSEKNL